jgi:hypothetical protein
MPFNSALPHCRITGDTEGRVFEQGGVFYRADGTAWTAPATRQERITSMVINASGEVTGIVQPDGTVAQVSGGGASPVPSMAWREDGTHYCTIQEPLNLPLDGWHNTLWLSPRFVPNDFSLTDLGLNINANATQAQTARFAIYADSNGFPGAKLAEAGPTSLITGDSILHIPMALEMTAGIYWVGFICGIPASAGTGAEVEGHMLNTLASGIGCSGGSVARYVMGLENDDFVYANLTEMPDTIPSFDDGTYIFDTAPGGTSGMPSITMRSLPA